MSNIILVAVLASNLFGLAHVLPDQAWKDFKLEYGKFYENKEEEEFRYSVWKQHVEQVKLHNAEYAHEYEQGINEYSDMTEEEFQFNMCNCVNIPNKNRTTYGFENIDDSAIPDTVNWATKGFVTPVKSQRNCGSCYSFSATGGLEGQWFRKTGHLPSLSEQQIVDCSRKWGNKGCGGGWYESAWEYIRDVGGSDTEDAYPYEAKEGKCRFNAQKVGAKVKSVVSLPTEDERALKKAVGTVGPVSVAIHVKDSLRHYKQGVYYTSRCLKEFWQLNHAVLAVGYGTENGKDYWLIKNSWGPRFGLSGYFKMARNRNNVCGVATKASYPVV